MKKETTGLNKSSIHQADVWKSKSEILKSGLVSGKKPYPRKVTQATQTWLNKRFSAEYAIMAAADYGVNNLTS